MSVNQYEIERSIKIWARHNNLSDEWAKSEIDSFHDWLQDQKAKAWAQGCADAGYGCGLHANPFIAEGKIDYDEKTFKYAEDDTIEEQEERYQHFKGEL